MKKNFALIATVFACILALCTSCKKEQVPGYFVYASDLSRVGDEIVCTKSGFLPAFIAFDGKNVLVVDAKRRYLQVEFMEDSGDRFVFSAVNAEPFGFEGWACGFNARPETTYPATGSAVVTYDDGVIRFSKTIKLSLKQLPEAVDLGLSVKWASFNVGATKPEEAGSYFAWGETEPKKNYDWTMPGDYKWGVHTSATADFGMTKYTSTKGDGLTILSDLDDPAKVHFGSDWSSPTYAQIQELCNSSDLQWTWNEEKQGYDVLSKTTAKSIFLPLAGIMSKENLNSRHSYSAYWSSEVFGRPDMAFFLYLNLSTPGFGTSDRCNGMMIRAVCK